jgi:hypothetical protein
MGLRVLNSVCPCGTEHMMYIGEDGYFDATVFYEYECPSRKTRCIMRGFEAAEMDAAMEKDDVLARRIPPQTRQGGSYPPPVTV